MELLQFFFGLVVLGVQAAVVSFVFWSMYALIKKLLD